MSNCKTAYRVSLATSGRISPAFASIFSIPGRVSARVGPMLSSKTGFFNSRACLTSLEFECQVTQPRKHGRTRLNAEYVARVVPISRSLSPASMSPNLFQSSEFLVAVLIGTRVRPGLYLWRDCFPKEDDFGFVLSSWRVR